MNKRVGIAAILLALLLLAPTGSGLPANALAPDASRAPTVDRTGLRLQRPGTRRLVSRTADGSLSNRPAAGIADVGSLSYRGGSDSAGA